MICLIYWLSPRLYPQRHLSSKQDYTKIGRRIILRPINENLITLERSMKRIWLIGLLILVLVFVVTGVVLTRLQVYAAPDQPIAYSHRVHVQAGVECLYCHPSALQSPVAGIPSVQKCMGCHNVIKTESPEIKQVASYYEAGKPIPWVRINRQPDFIYFNHQPHLGAALNCEICHGDVGQMEVTTQFTKMDMGWCLGCHLDQPEEKVGRLADCLTCHK